MSKFAILLLITVSFISLIESQIFCDGIISTDETVCSGRGNCTSNDTCVCEPVVWFEAYTEKNFCSGVAGFMDYFNLAIAVVVVLAAFLIYTPQNKTTDGVSYLTIWLMVLSFGGLSLNNLLKKAPLLFNKETCIDIKCVNGYGSFVMVLSSFIGCVVHLSLYLIYYVKDFNNQKNGIIKEEIKEEIIDQVELKVGEEEKTDEGEEGKEEKTDEGEVKVVNKKKLYFFCSLTYFGLFLIIVILGCLIALSIVLITVYRDNNITNRIGDIIGITCSVLIFIRWLPQILVTLFGLSSGNFSILTIILALPANVAFIPIMIMRGELFTTYLAYIVSTACMVFELILCIIFDIKDKLKEKEKKKAEGSSDDKKEEKEKEEVISESESVDKEEENKEEEKLLVTENKEEENMEEENKEEEKLLVTESEDGEKEED